MAPLTRAALAIPVLACLFGAAPATRPAAYGEPIERTLNPNASRADRWLDLDTGKLHDWPENAPQPGHGIPLNDCLKPLRDKGVDLLDDAGGVVLDCVVMPVSRLFWDMPPQETHLAILRESQAGTFTFLHMPGEGEKDAGYYFFRTREGTIGILHLIGREYREQGPMPWKLEYRVLEHPGQ